MNKFIDYSRLILFSDLILIVFCAPALRRALKINVVCMSVRRSVSTQLNKFTISMQYLQENRKDKVDFLPVDKRQKFLQTDTII